MNTIIKAIPFYLKTVSVACGSRFNDELKGMAISFKTFIKAKFNFLMQFTFSYHIGMRCCDEKGTFYAVTKGQQQQSDSFPLNFIPLFAQI